MRWFQPTVFFPNFAKAVLVGSVFHCGRAAWREPHVTEVTSFYWLGMLVAFSLWVTILCFEYRLNALETRS